MLSHIALALCFEHLHEWADVAQIHGELKTTNLRGEDSTRVGGVVHKGDIQLNGDIPARGDFVWSRARGEQASILEEDALLHCEHTKSLGKRPLHLTNVDGRIDAVSHIHE